MRLGRKRPKRLWGKAGCAKNIHAFNGWPKPGEDVVCVFCGAVLTVGERAT